MRRGRTTSERNKSECVVRGVLAYSRGQGRGSRWRQLVGINLPLRPVLRRMPFQVLFQGVLNYLVQIVAGPRLRARLADRKHDLLKAFVLVKRQPRPLFHPPDDCGYPLLVICNQIRRTMIVSSQGQQCNRNLVGNLTGDFVWPPLTAPASMGMVIGAPLMPLLAVDVRTASVNRIELPRT
jgi:hypothetical protein